MIILLRVLFMGGTTEKYRRSIAGHLITFHQERTSVIRDKQRKGKQKNHKTKLTFITKDPKYLETICSFWLMLKQCNKALLKTHFSGVFPAVKRISWDKTFLSAFINSEAHIAPAQTCSAVSCCNTRTIHGVYVEYCRSSMVLWSDDRDDIDYTNIIIISLSRSSPGTGPCRKKNYDFRTVLRGFRSFRQGATRSRQSALRHEYMVTLRPQ